VLLTLIAAAGTLRVTSARGNVAAWARLVDAPSARRAQTAATSATSTRRPTIAARVAEMPVGPTCVGHVAATDKYMCDL
jgi:hypothetical protein